MLDDESERMSDAELKAFFDQLLPGGVAGDDIIAGIAPEGWANSPLLACFHPSIEQVFQERLQMHRNMEELVRARREREPDNPKFAVQPEPTIEELRADWKETPIKEKEEVTELIGQCLWDLFSDNHEVIAADGRVVDIGSFRGAASFIDEYISGVVKSFDTMSWEELLKNMDYMKYYMGTVWISRRADLTPVYDFLFGRLKEMGADWEYHFPELGIVDFGGLREDTEKPEDYSPSESFEREQKEKERQEELAKTRAQLDEGNREARREAMDRPPPATVRSYQNIFGRDPDGWPPA